MIRVDLRTWHRRVDARVDAGRSQRGLPLHAQPERYLQNHLRDRRHDAMLRMELAARRGSGAG